MKAAGIFLILTALVVLLGYGFYVMVLHAAIPLGVKLGLAALAMGFLLVLLALIRERMGDIKKEEAGRR